MNGRIKPIGWSIFSLRAYVVVDLGFGDAGKGLMTDFLVRQFDAGLVVRYNGGAQAGHNVVTADGRHHTFSQFGCGTFTPGVKTYLSKYVVIHPTALLVEGDMLIRMGVQDVFSRLRLSDQALIITPFHQAANRIREMARGPERHGSCGIGVGEAYEDALLNAEDCIRAADLTDPHRLERKLRSIRDQKYEQLADLRKINSSADAFTREWTIFEDDDVLGRWIAAVSRLHELDMITPDSALQNLLGQTETAIFEGAQGVLLDADKGFHPFTTWSRCTSANANELIEEMAPDSSVFQVGVMRSHAVRHGPGPLPTETEAFKSVISEHNQYNEWQGMVRYGWFDAVLARYALAVAGKVDVLAVTHMDMLPRLETWNYCAGYQQSQGFDNTFINPKVSSGLLTKFSLLPSASLDQRAQFTQALFEAIPALESCTAKQEEVIQKIESLLGQSVGMISNGPSAENIQILKSIAS